MNLKLPYGAEAIVRLRKQGLRPAEMILVSLIGPLYGEGNPVVIATPGRQYDLRFLAGLECLVVSDSTQPKQVVRDIVEQLKALPTAYLGVWFADSQQGINFIVGGVTSRPHGLYRYMTTEDRQNFAGLGHQEISRCA
ncbi:MAG: hypothetical protein Q8S26_01925 [Azonexus sp.]|nr:hypothetical protein [Azonexus sp.]